MAKSIILDLSHVFGAPLSLSNWTFCQCINCWSILRSNPSDNQYCVCRNISVDVDARRARARNEQLFRVLQLTHAGEY